MVYRSGTVVWIRNPKRAFSQTQHMGVSRYPLNSAVGFTYLHQSQPAKRQNQVMITSSIFEFSGRLDTFESDIIMERQRGENWISQVISEALVCRFVGDISIIHVRFCLLLSRSIAIDVRYSDLTGNPPHALKTFPVILPSTALTYNLAVSAAVTSPLPSCPGSTMGAGLTTFIRIPLGRRDAVFLTNVSTAAFNGPVAMLAGFGYWLK